MNLFNMGNPDFWIRMLYYLPGIIIALSFHEFAHAFVAHLVGDDTARNMGRMTVNPLAHLDPIGFISMILLGFGWAKPVPVTPRNYRGSKRRADIFVSLAGITMNLLLAILFLLLFYLLNLQFGGINSVANRMIYYAIVFNLSLMIFNLIPIHPLDGSHVLEDLLIRRTGPKPFMFMRQYSMYLLLGLLIVLNVTGILSTVLDYVLRGLNTLFSAVFGVDVLDLFLRGII